MATQTLEQQTEEDSTTLSKSRMLSTINRYSLGNEIKRVKWKIEDNGLFTGFVSPDNSVFGVLKVQDFPIQDSTIGIFDTKRLKALVRILEDEFTASLEKHGGEFKLMILDDGKKTIQFELASLDVIPNTPQLKHLPEWQVETEITDEFISDFRSAEGAINQDEFGVKTTADGVEVFLLIAAVQRRGDKHFGRVGVCGCGKLKLYLVCCRSRPCRSGDIGEPLYAVRVHGHFTGVVALPESCLEHADGHEDAVAFERHVHYVDCWSHTLLFDGDRLKSVVG